MASESYEGMTHLILGPSLFRFYPYLLLSANGFWSLEASKSLKRIMSLNSGSRFYERPTDCVCVCVCVGGVHPLYSQGPHSSSGLHAGGT